MLPQPGRYTVIAEQAVVSEAGSGALQLALNCKIDEQTGIIAYLYFVSKNGEILTKTIDRLKEVFGWDGQDFFWFEDTDISGIQFDITVENEEYNGKVSPKVKWINKVGDGPSGALGQSADRRAILAKYGMQLRALNGGKPATKQTTTTQPPRYAQPQTSTLPKTFSPATMEEVWQLLCQKGHDAGKSQDDCTAAWQTIISRIGDQSSMTPEQWGEAMSYAETYFNA
jgi:hypothetical protein